ncbi:TonB-dependent receptor [Pedobacter sp. BS3]|uniref:TonB-dependent receptor n=1 Tax=Pedobacter sp. BS3 TaxID=2567937 RepID=UPI001658F16C|nr:TonB-dependent receptor [Pedobacter sp. BS3]
MKLTAILLLVFNLHVSALTYGQQISMSENNISLKDAFKELRAKTGYYFIYNNDALSGTRPVSIHVQNVSINEALDQLLDGQGLSYKIEDKIIIVNALNKPVISSAEVQTRTITGQITDNDDGSPLAGVSIRIKGTTTGTISDADGNFSMVVKSSDKILQLTYIGYATKEVTLTAANKYNISMSLEAKQLNEVAIAFGTSTQRELTNSVTQITAKDIELRPIANLNDAIAGAAPGVQTNAGSGQPGEGPDIRIRGFSSITNSNGPLYVLDGAPYEGVINNINPDDIESISLLKDASATALYGARAANGIILITTKKGKRNRNNINIKLTHAISERGLPDYEKVDAYQYYELIWESLKNGTSGSPEQASKDIKTYLGWNPFNVADDEVVLPSGTINPQARLLYPEDLSFKDAIQRTGLRTDLLLSLMGGSAKSDYYVSLDYLDQNGYVIGSDFKRYSGRVRVNSQPVKWLSVGLNLYGNYTKSDQANESSGINENPFYVDLLLAPIYPVHIHNPVTGAYILDENGNQQYDPADYRPLMTGRNIIAETLYNINQIRRNSIIANTNAEITFLKDFKFSTTFSANLGNYRSNVYDNATIGDAVGVGRATRTNSMTAYLNFNQLLNYEKKFGVHKVKVLLGHENYLSYYDYITGSRRNQAVEGSSVLDNFTTTTNLSSYDRLYKTEGYISRLDYSYDGRYLASASYRRDGSSKFHPDRKWGNFWSVSAGWNIDREDFFKADWVDLLKLRASYGEVGNDNISGYFAYQALYDLNYNNGSEPGALYTKAAADSLVWESNANADIALEFGLFKNRLNGSFEVFHRQSHNLLFPVSTTLLSGVLTQNANFGSMRNQGLEINLNGDIIRKKNFKWNMGINWTTFKNKIISLPQEYENKISGTKKYATGESMYEFWLRDWYGVDPETGADLYWTGDTVTTTVADAQYHYTGSAIPDFYGSINNTFTYKNFSLQLMFLYQVGGYAFDNDYESLMYRGSAGRALHVDALKRWRNPGDVTSVPKRTTGTSMYDSDRWLTDASYLNLRTAAVTYSLPKKFISRYGIQSARAYVSGENLFITSARKGMDPTQTYTGSPSYTYAPSRIISFGLNVTL